MSWEFLEKMNQKILNETNKGEVGDRIRLGSLIVPFLIPYFNRLWGVGNLIFNSAVILCKRLQFPSLSFFNN